MLAAAGKKRREQILEVATRHFASAGYTGTSMRALAREVGISAPAIYRHFPSKLALFEQVIGARSQSLKIQEDLTAFRREFRVEDMLRGVSLHLLSTVRRQPEVLRLLLLTSMTGEEEAQPLLQKFRRPYIDFLTSELQRRVDSGDLLKVNPGITARCYVGMVIGCAVNAQVWNRLDGVCYDTHDVVNNNVPIFARGLLASPEAEQGRSGPQREEYAT